MYIASWSGGKDSCFACYKALQEGYKVTRLVNFISKEYQRVSFHGIERGLIKIQSELAGIPLFQKETTPDNYEGEFKDAVKSIIDSQNPTLPCLKRDNAGGLQNTIRGMVFGDLYLEEHREWVERVCKELRLEAIELLWKRNTEELMLDFIGHGFQAVVVSGQTKFIDKEWIGHSIDKDFIEYLKTKTGVDICGENGEYHSFVVSGPLFRGRISITGKEVISRNGYWFLDIKDFRVVYA